MLALELQSQFSAQQVAGRKGSISSTVTAAGSTQGTATALSSQYNRITTASLMQGVILPASQGVGDEIEVVNATTVNICVYPPVGGSLNGNSANVPVVVAPRRAHTFFCADGTNWDVDAI